MRGKKDLSIGPNKWQEKAIKAAWTNVSDDNDMFAYRLRHLAPNDVTMSLVGKMQTPPSLSKDLPKELFKSLYDNIQYYEISITSPAEVFVEYERYATEEEAHQVWAYWLQKLDPKLFKQKMTPERRHGRQPNPLKR